MAETNSPIASGRRAKGSQQLSQAQLDQLQLLRIRATQQFLASSNRYASAAITHEATAALIPLIIDRWPSCPGFASILVDQLLAGDEALAEALRQELGDG